jgi:hypothetical protein
MDSEFPFEIAHKTSEVRGNWHDANEHCKSLGEGWRLPTLGELDLIYNGNNDFEKYCYWAIDSHTLFPNFAWGMYMSNGKTYDDTKHYGFHYSRAVRDI